MESVPYPYNTPPWRRDHSAKSPDGLHSAEIRDAWELSMSGPTYGRLKLSNGFELELCSPVFIWSDDSRYLAAPQWIRWCLFGTKQRIVVVDVKTSVAYAMPGKYRLLILKNFDSGVITGIDSPLWRPRDVRLSVDEYIEDRYRI